LVWQVSHTPLRHWRPAQQLFAPVHDCPAEWHVSQTLTIH
jgi:hypothetical protein